MDKIILKQVRSLERRFSQQDKKIKKLEETAAEYLRISRMTYEQNVVINKKSMYLDKIIVWYENKFNFKRDRIPVDEL